MDAAEYKHVALGLIFLKYISDRFEERRAQAFAENPPDLAEEFAEDRDWYTSESVFWVPEKARWDFVKANATSVEPTIGQLIDEAMISLENENAGLKGVLTKNYARPELDQVRLGEVIKLFSDLAFRDEHHGEDVLGRVYEYFLGQFAIAEGKRGGQFYTAGSSCGCWWKCSSRSGPRLRSVLRETAYALAAGDQRKNLAVETLRRLLAGEIKARERTNMVL